MHKIQKLFYAVIIIMFALPLVTVMYSIFASIPITDALLQLIVNLIPVIFLIGVVYALWKWDNKTEFPPIPSE